jgi:hypothetical protein
MRSASGYRGETDGRSSKVTDLIVVAVVLPDMSLWMCQELMEHSEFGISMHGKNHILTSS